MIYAIAEFLTCAGVIAAILVTVTGFVCLAAAIFADELWGFLLIGLPIALILPLGLVSMIYLSVNEEPRPTVLLLR